jgi:uncharacterized repeat protein (TIGR01451 family)
MKKFYLLTIALCFINLAKAQTVNIPDANFKQFLLYCGTGVYSDNAKDANGNAITIDTNHDNEIQMSEALTVYQLNVALYLYNTPILTFEGIRSFSNLTKIWVQNQDGPANLDLHDMLHLEYLYGNQSFLTDINLQGCVALKTINLDHTNTYTMNITGCNAIEGYNNINNYVPGIDLSNRPNLTSMQSYGSGLQDVNLQGSTNLASINIACQGCGNMNFEGLVHLTNLTFSSGAVQTLDLTTLHSLKTLHLHNGNLEYLYIKNGSQETDVTLSGCTGLKYICKDETDYQQNGAIFLAGITGCVVNSYCNFVPGGDYYSIEGNNRYDSNSNGCDVADVNYPYMRFNLSNSTYYGTHYCDASGAYAMPVQTGSHVMTPVIENPPYFTVSPASAVVNFPTQVSPQTKNFCISKTGVYPDLEVYIYSGDHSLPGNDTTYFLHYRNKGTEIQSGTLTLQYDNGVLHYLSSNTNLLSQTENVLTFGFTNLQPFETRMMTVKFHLNSPMDTPPAEVGNYLHFAAALHTTLTDITPNDNVFEINDMIVGPFDPNNKFCLQGDKVPPSMIGQYVYYKINFENLGTAAAQNVVVRDQIDSNKFDMNTLTVLGSSHPVFTRISYFSRVEFIFDNIQLPFDDAQNDGYVIFKIKMKPSLAVGDTFANSAEIYFDYNAPVATNTYTTTISALGTNDFEFSKYVTLWPNPAADKLHIKSTGLTVKSISIYNVLGQLVQVITNASEVTAMDVSNLKSGHYFIKINSDKGVSSARFIKE